MVPNWVSRAEWPTPQQIVQQVEQDRQRGSAAGGSGVEVTAAE